MVLKFYYRICSSSEVTVSVDLRIEKPI